MTPELIALALAGLMHIAQFALASVMANQDLGMGFTSSPRDRAPSREMRTTTARMLRAYDNHAQMFGLFAGGCLLIAVTQQTTPVTAFAAFHYLACRAPYIPAYLYGWKPWRSFLWLGALAACAVLFLAALL